MKQATLCFLLQGDEVLLGMKKTGLGAGKWNGIGGKIEEGESPEEAARREVREEIGVVAVEMKKVGFLRFFFPEGTPYAAWNQEVHVYVARRWDGEPQESDEMAPQWHLREEIPYDRMWADDAHWLPVVLRGEKIEADFYFADDKTIADFTMRELTE